MSKTAFSRLTTLRFLEGGVGVGGQSDSSVLEKSFMSRALSARSSISIRLSAQTRARVRNRRVSSRAEEKRFTLSAITYTGNRTCSHGNSISKALPLGRDRQSVANSASSKADRSSRNLSTWNFLGRWEPLNPTAILCSDASISICSPVT